MAALPGQQSRLYSLLRSEQGGSVALRCGNQGWVVTKDGSCSCGQPECLHAVVVTGLRGWDAFAPRQGLLASDQELTDALADTVAETETWIEGNSAYDSWRTVFASLGRFPISRGRSLRSGPFQAQRVGVHRLDVAGWDPSRGWALYCPWGRAQRHLLEFQDRGVDSPEAASLLQALALRLGRALAEANRPVAQRVLGLWHQVLRAHGLEDPSLPLELPLCPYCGHLADLSGVCPYCLRAELLQYDEPPLTASAGYLPEVFRGGRAVRASNGRRGKPCWWPPTE